MRWRRASRVGEPETFGLRSAAHFLDRKPQLPGCASTSPSTSGAASAIGGREHGHAFVRRGPRRPHRHGQADRDGTRRSAPASPTCDPEVVPLGVRRIPARRVHDAARDARPPSRDVADRDLALRRDGVGVRSAVAAVAANAARGVREHDSQSVQHTLHAMGAGRARDASTSRRRSAS